VTSLTLFLTDFQDLFLSQRTQMVKNSTGTLVHLELSSFWAMSTPDSVTIAQTQ